MSPSPPSRRRFPRIPSDNLVLINTVGGAEAEQLARTRNVSLGGCMVSVRQRLGVGTMVQVLIKVDDQVVDSLGRVVYERPRRSGDNDVGIEFLYLSDPDQRRLRALLERVAQAAPPA